MKCFKFNPGMVISFVTRIINIYVLLLSYSPDINFLSTIEHNCYYIFDIFDTFELHQSDSIVALSPKNLLMYLCFSQLGDWFESFSIKNQ